MVDNNVAKDYSGEPEPRKVMHWIRNPNSKKLGNTMTDELLQTAAILFIKRKTQKIDVSETTPHCTI